MTTPAFDPYKPPVETTPGIQNLAALSELVGGWEKLRLLYNAIMILPGLGVLALWITRAGMPWQAALTLGFITGIGANCAFFLGPLSELYLRGFFRAGEGIGKGRSLIFCGGLVVSAGVLLLASIIPVFWSA